MPQPDDDKPDASRKNSGVSVADIWAAMQNGAQALQALSKQIQTSFSSTAPST